MSPHQQTHYFTFNFCTFNIAGIFQNPISIQLHTAFSFQLYQVRHDKYQHLYLSQTKVRFGNISMDAAGRYITTM